MSVANSLEKKIFYFILSVIFFISLSILLFIILLEIGRAYGLNLGSLSEGFWVVDSIAMLIFAVTGLAVSFGDD